LELLDSSGKKLSELLDALPDYPTSREKVACPDKQKVSVMEKVNVELKKEFPDVLRTLTIDGIRLELRDGWVLVRPSGTEPYIRVTAEARTSERAREIAEKAVKVLNNVMQG
jgi:phosphoglucosamine mutase